MQKKINKLPILLSVFVIVLSAFASSGGIFIKGIYRDNELICSVWLGNDIVTLFVVIPLMILAIFYALRGSLRAYFLWKGMLWYMVYNYIFYMYGAAFNKFFLLYVCIFTFSIVSIIILLTKLDKETLLKCINFNLPLKWVIVYMWFFALFIGIMWIVMSLSYVFTNNIPAAITQTGHSTGVVFATDLSFLVPVLIIGAILLWRKDVWGYVLALIILVKCSLYPVVLLIGGAIAYQRTGIWDDFIPAYLILWIGCILSLSVLIKGVKSTANK